MTQAPSTPQATAAAGEVSLQATGLTFSIADLVTVGPIDLTVPRGATVGVVGETGSGKSLLCRALVGMLDRVGGRIQNGSIQVTGRDLTEAPSGEWVKLRRTRVAYMPQASLSGLNPVRRVSRQLTEVLTGSKDQRHAAAVTLLQQVQLHDPERVLRSYPHQLSGGMRQRVMIAMALAGDPELLVADEPTTALDATVQEEVLALLKKIQQDRGMSVVIVTHDMRVVRRVCDHLAVMYGGRIVESGPVEDVVRRPRHPYTLGLLRADPALATRRAPLGAVEGAPRTADQWNDGGCNFRERCPLATQICQDQDPALMSAGGTQLAACHHSQEVPAR